MPSSGSRSKTPNFIKYNSRSWANMIEQNDPNFFKPKSRSRSKAVDPKEATAAAKAFGKGEIPHGKQARCQRGATCTDPNCLMYHGPKECNFAAGKHINTRKWLPGGKPNPQKGKAMACGKGSRCEFNHRNVTLRASTAKKVHDKARLEHTPVLHSEADLVAAYPNIEYRAGDAWSTNEMSRLDQECLMRSLKKSPVEYKIHGDFIEINF
jgi:hypothetical protein